MEKNKKINSLDGIEKLNTAYLINRNRLSSFYRQKLKFSRRELELSF